MAEQINSFLNARRQAEVSVSRMMRPRTVHDLFASNVQCNRNSSTSTQTNFIEEKLSVLRDDIWHLYKEKILCDVTLKADDKTFLAHKAILSTRSPVFHAMFERNMKEKDSGIVDITDVDSDTLDKMLTFVYSAELEDLAPGIAVKLYSAADKYQILALREQCWKYLASILNVSNVCDVVLLADMHSDSEMRNSAYDFICSFSNDVFTSDEWIDFMKKHPGLAAEIMHRVFLQKNLS